MRFSIFDFRLCAVGLLLLVSGCASPAWKPAEYPALAPATQPVAALGLDSSQIQPMYRDMVRVDLPTVVKVASAQSIDIQQAVERVTASRGRYDSSVEALLPVVSPTIAFQHFEGMNQAANGTLTHINADTFLPSISLQWILNPGKVAYDIVASKRRLEASQQQEESVVQETMRQAAVQYYDLVLAQARLAVARQAVAEAQELLRITQLRVRAGTGLSADELRSQASLASSEQDFVVGMFNFFEASVALTLTLHMDPAVTLVPQPEQIAQTTLVRDDLPIDQMLANALQYRADLESIRTLVRAASADAHSVGWSGLGPQVQANYTYGGIAADTDIQDFSLHQQQKAGAGAGFALDFSTLGRLKTAGATQRIAVLEAERQMDRVRAAVVSAQQSSLAQAKLVPVSREQLQSAEEALRLTQANLQAGTMLTLDVLQAQRDLDGARLRYSDAVVRYNQSQVNLLAAMGVLDRRNLLPAAEQPSTLPTTMPISKAN